MFIEQTPMTDVLDTGDIAVKKACKIPSLMQSTSSSLYFMNSVIMLIIT